MLCSLSVYIKKKVAEVSFRASWHLIFEVPVVSQGDGGMEFVTEVMKELKYLWPQLSLMHGKSGHSQSQETAEHLNSNIKEMFMECMADNNWWGLSMEICFVHFAKNLAHHLGINRALYSALFGTDPRCGLTSTSLQSDIISLMTEDDLVSVLTTPVASPHSTACASSEDPTNTATRAETVTELSSGSPSNEIHPWPQKPPLTQSVETHSFVPPEFMASGQPLATPNSKADLCLH